MAGVVINPKLDCTKPTCMGTETVQRFENEDDGAVTGFCFKCDKYYNGEAVQRLEGSEVAYTVEKKALDPEIYNLCPVLDFPERGLKAGALKYFGIKAGLSQQNGQEIVRHLYPYYKGSELLAIKHRIIQGKKFYTEGTFEDCDPFGWQQAKQNGGYTLYITEGELDAVALFTAWHREKKQKISVISLKNGKSSVVKTLKPKMKEIIASFKKVVLVFDQDEAGKEAEQEAMKLFPDNFRPQVVRISEKDANDMLVQGKSAELINACYNPIIPEIAGLLQVKEDMFDALYETLEYGKSFPWNKLTDMLRGYRRGEVIYWGAPPKMG